MRRSLLTAYQRAVWPLARGGGAPAEADDAVDFDGTNDYLTRGADLTGAVDHAQGISSAWVRLDGGDGAAQFLLHSTRDTIQRTAGGGFTFALRNSTGASLFGFSTVNTYTASATWLHVLASWDTNATAGNKVAHLYINDVSDKGANTDAAAAFNVDYTTGDWGIGGSTAGASLLDGCLAYYYFAPGQFLDFSVEANRRKFITAGGKPADLGADGSTPTGTAPLIYLNGDETDFQVNLGTGGDFTVTGTLTAASTSPSD